jgi:hypothetical protein
VTAATAVNLTFGAHGLRHSFPYSTIFAGFSRLIFTTSTKTESPQTELGTQGSGTARSRPILRDRNLLAAGLRSESGRGNSAARMTARDASHLLVAVLASSRVPDSVETVRQYSEAGFHNISSGGYDVSLIAALRNSPPDHNFVDTIEALVAAAAGGPPGNCHARHCGRDRGEEYRIYCDNRDYRPSPGTWQYFRSAATGSPGTGNE